MKKKYMTTMQVSIVSDEDNFEDEEVDLGPE